MKPPLVLIEVNNTDGFPDPVVTKEDGVAMVTIDWRGMEDVEPELLAEQIRVLAKYEGEHPRIDLVLKRLREARKVDSAP